MSLTRLTPYLLSITIPCLFWIVWVADHDLEADPYDHFSEERYEELLENYNTSPIKEIGALRIMTFNARYDASGDKGERSWKKRLPRIIEMIRFYEPDLIGTQELLNNQRKDLKAKLKDYGEFGEPRNGYYFGVIASGEFNTIFYKKERLEKLSSGTFWLNEGMEPYEKGWNAVLPRICTWGEFFDNESQTPFWFFNTHLSHRSSTAKKEGMALITEIAAEKTEDMAGLAFIGGDFNSSASSVLHSEYGKQFKDTRNLTQTKDGPSSTYTGFSSPKRRIDFLLINRNQETSPPIQRHVVIQTKDSKKYPLSDHLPLFIDINLTE